MGKEGSCTQMHRRRPLGEVALALGCSSAPDVDLAPCVGPCAGTMIALVYLLRAIPRWKRVLTKGGIDTGEGAWAGGRMGRDPRPAGCRPCCSPLTPKPPSTPRSWPTRRRQRGRHAEQRRGGARAAGGERQAARWGRILGQLGSAATWRPWKSGVFLSAPTF